MYVDFRHSVFKLTHSFSIRVLRVLFFLFKLVFPNQFNFKMPNAQHEINRVMYKLLGEEKGMDKLFKDHGNFRVSYGGIIETARNDDINRDLQTKTTTDTAKNSSVHYSTAWRHMKMFFHLCHKWKNLCLILRSLFLKESQQCSN